MSEINRDSKNRQLTKRVARRTSGVTKALLLGRSTVITLTGQVRITPIKKQQQVQIPVAWHEIIAARLTCYPVAGAKGTNVNDQILNAIDQEIARLRQARAVLAGGATPSVRKKPTAAVTHAKARRKLSAKARKAIADAQRKRWAKVKGQKTAK
jgi:hypothetical protein